MSTEKFTCFPDLPPELRCLIWEFGARISKSVELRQVRLGKEVVFRSEPHFLLHVNKESRRETLRNLPNRLMQTGVKKVLGNIRLNPYTDIIFMGKTFLSAMFGPLETFITTKDIRNLPITIGGQVLKNVRYFMIKMSTIEFFGYWISSKLFTYLALAFPSLQAFALVEDKFSRDSDGRATQTEFRSEAERMAWSRGLSRIEVPHSHPNDSIMVGWRNNYFRFNHYFRLTNGVPITRLPPLRFFGRTYPSRVRKLCLDQSTDHQLKHKIQGLSNSDYCDVDPYRLPWCVKCQRRKWESKFKDFVELLETKREKLVDEFLASDIRNLS